jgi:RND superfamily putative drug exporter
VAYGVATSARTITSAALIMIAVFIGFAFAGMPLVAQLGVACAVAIAIDATVVRLVLVPSLMAMFDQWNWWLPAWLDRILPSVDFEKPLPKLDLGDLVVLPDEISAIAPPAGDLRMVVKNAARLKEMAPDAVCVADPLAFSGCGNRRPAKSSRGPRSATLRPIHPVTIWRGRLAVALDALGTETDVERSSPVETTNVQLPTGDRLQIPTGAETLRLQSYLVLCRNSRSDYAELADLAEAMNIENAATVLAGIDEYYSSGKPHRMWIATQLVRRLADPVPADTTDDDRWYTPDAAAQWDDVRTRCLSLAVATLEEAS